MPYRSHIATAILTAAVFLPPGFANADSLGIANDYNIFALNDMTMSRAASEGKVAVAHNANLTSYTVGPAGSSASATNFIVGNNWTATTSGIINGTAIVGGTVSAANVTVNGTLDVNGNTAITGTTSVVTGGVVNNGTFSSQSGIAHTPGFTPLPLSFSDAATYLTAHSTYWATLPNVGAVTSQFGNLLLTGTNASLNVFNLTNSVFSSASTFTVNAPANSTVLINVSGAVASQANNIMGFTGGIDGQHVLFNFPTATSVTLGGNFSFHGSVLAPLATVNLTQYGVAGTVVGKNISGSGLAALDLFQGDLPAPPIPLPAPASAVASIALLLIIGGQNLLLTRKNVR